MNQQIVMNTMGTAGLNVDRLAGLLERLKIDCTIVDGDHARDHCVLRISSLKRPEVIGFVEYENQGIEPRLVGITIRDSNYSPNADDYPLDWEKEIKLQGARKDDPDKIATWIEEEFLKKKNKNSSNSTDA